MLINREYPIKKQVFRIWFVALAQLALVSAVRAGGLVAAWGDDSTGQTTLPIGVSNVTAIAAGARHNVAARADGSVVAWGYDDGSGATIVPPGLTNVVAVSAGSDWSMALKADGTVAAWGGYGAVFDVEGLTNITAIAAGWYHWLALQSNGTVATDGDFVPPGLSNVVAIAAGINYSAFLISNGTVVTYGSGDATYGYGTVPPGLSNVVTIAVGYQETLALKNDGTVVVWGDFAGALPTPPGLSNVVAIAGGQVNNLALTSDGSVVAWAAGTNGYAPAFVPPGMSNVQAIAAGELHNLALLPSGPVQVTQDVQPLNLALPLGSNVVYSVGATGAGTLNYQWFLNGSAVTNNSRISGATGPTLNVVNLQMSDMGVYTVVVSNVFGSVISSGAALTVISAPFIAGAFATNLVMGAGASVTLAPQIQGTPPLAYQWFFNGTILGAATTAALTLTNVQSGQSGLYSVLAVNGYGSTQANFSLMVTGTPPHLVTQPAGGSVLTGSTYAFSVSALGSQPLDYQWQFNSLPYPGATNAALVLTNLTIKQTGYYRAVVSNAFGSVTSAAALLTVGQTSVVVWNGGAGEPTNSPPGLTNAVAIAAGSYHIIVLNQNGTVTTWAGTGLPSPAVTNVPASVTNVVAIAAGCNISFSTSMALRANGTVVVWGDDFEGITSVPSTATNVTAIADGGDHCLALRNDGSIVGWGYNDFGQAGGPPGLSNVVAIAAGAFCSYALKNDGTLVAWGSNVNLPNETNLPPGLSNVIAISAASVNIAGVNVALLADGLTTNWGYPVTSSGATNIVAVSGGDGSLAALRTDGRLFLSGAPAFPSSISNVIAVASGGISNIPGFVAAIVNTGAPVITVQPLNQTTAPGATAQFHVRAAGAPTPATGSPQQKIQTLQPLSYQWQFIGTNLPGATNEDLIITNAQAANAGPYQAIVTNYLGSATSLIARLSIPNGGGAIGSNAPVLVIVPLSTPQNMPNGAFTFSCSIASGTPVDSNTLSALSVQVSADLIHWATLPNNVLTVSNGVVQVQDPAATNAPARFYRLVQN